MFPERAGLIIWVSDLKSARNLERYGTIHYMSKKMQYVVMYLNADKVEETIKHLQKFPYVKKIEHSFRSEIKTEYSNNIPDKTRFYTS
jgi:uncharacterized protein YlbG (UPF0298 family)